MGAPVNTSLAGETALLAHRARMSEGQARHTREAARTGA